MIARKRVILSDMCRTLLASVPIIACALVAPTIVRAAEWFQGPFCDKAGCSPAPCAKANNSPADVYEKNKYRGAEIVEKGDGVEVLIPPEGMKFTYFRNVESCQKYRDELSRAVERMREEERQKLDKYR
jgi:hypothetical protein